MIIHETNLDKTILFFYFEKKKLRFNLRDENDNRSYNVAKDHIMQCKHMISYNKLFNLRYIGKYWYKRYTITQSYNISTYISPRFFKKLQKLKILTLFN